jgi:hypothetical protein
MYNLFYCVGVFFFPDIVGFDLPSLQADKVGEHEILGAHQEYHPLIPVLETLLWFRDFLLDG